MVDRNREAHNARKRAAYHADPAHYLAAQKLHRERQTSEQREARLAKMREYYHANREKFQAREKARPKRNRSHRYGNRSGDPIAAARRLAAIAKARADEAKYGIQRAGNRNP